MTEDAKAAYAKMVDVIVAMTSAANRLNVAVDELTSAVTTLSGAVAHLERQQAGHDEETGGR